MYLGYLETLKYIQNHSASSIIPPVSQRININNSYLTFHFMSNVESWLYFYFKLDEIRRFAGEDETVYKLFSIKSYLTINGNRAVKQTVFQCWLSFKKLSDHLVPSRGTVSFFKISNLCWDDRPEALVDCSNSVPQNVCLGQLAGERCSKSFAQAEGDREKELKLMLEWAFEGFLPTGPEGFVPPGRWTFITIYLWLDLQKHWFTVSVCSRTCLVLSATSVFLSLF